VLLLTSDPALLVPLPAAVTLQQRELDTLSAQTKRDGPAMAQKEDAVARLQTSIRHSTRDIEAKRAEMGTPLQVSCAWELPGCCCCVSCRLECGPTTCTRTPHMHMHMHMHCMHRGWLGPAAAAGCCCGLLMHSATNQRLLAAAACQDGLSSEDRATLAAVQARLAELEQQLEGLQGRRDQVGPEAAGLLHRLLQLMRCCWLAVVALQWVSAHHAAVVHQPQRACSCLPRMTTQVRPVRVTCQRSYPAMLWPTH
jgi:hypothetical protein